MRSVPRHSGHCETDWPAETQDPSPPRGTTQATKIVNDALKPGMDPKDLHETWTIFLCNGDPVGKKQVIYEETFAECRGRYLAHNVYFSTSVASRSFKDKDGAWKSPEPGIELDRWHDLLRWGFNMKVKSSDQVDGNDTLKQCVKESMDVDERGQSAVSDEFAKLLTENWAEATAKATAKAKADMEQTAMALLKDGMSPDKVAEVTRLSKKDVNRLKASLGSTKKPTQKSA